MAMLIHGTISISVSNKVMLLLPIGKGKVLGAGQIAKDSLCCLPVDAARIVKKAEEGRNCICDFRTGGNGSIHKASNGLTIRGFLHAVNFCGVRWAVIS